MSKTDLILFNRGAAAYQAFKAFDPRKPRMWREGWIAACTKDDHATGSK